MLPRTSGATRTGIARSSAGFARAPSAANPTIESIVPATTATPLDRYRLFVMFIFDSSGEWCPL